jgi:hypothetical protein
METNIEQEEVIIKFLLGQLDDEQRKQVEERFLTDSEYFERLLAVEGALADKYMLNKLTGETREQFKSLMRSSAYQWQEVEFARDVADAVRSTAASAEGPGAEAKEELTPPQIINAWRQSLNLRALAVAALLILAAGGLALMFLTASGRKEVDDLKAKARLPENAAQDRPNNNDSIAEHSAKADRPPAPDKNPNPESLNSEAPPQSLSKPAQDTARLVLTPEIVSRSGDGSLTLEMKPAARNIELQVRLGTGSYEKYGVSITTVDGIRVWEKYNLTNYKRYDRIILTLPARLFPTNDYILTLKGTASGNGNDYESIHDYLFSVRR